VWLDRGELDKILERSATELGTGPAAGSRPQADRPYERHDSGEHRAYGHPGHHKHHRRKSFLDDFFDFD
jgi:Zn-finger nucleic acid-binding protein